MFLAGQRRIVAYWRTLINLQGNPAVTQNDVPVVPATDGYGAVWVRDASAQQATQVNTFDLFNIPAAATQATATQASAGAGKRNVLTSLTVTLNAVAAQAMQVIEVLDGAVVIWSINFGALAVGTSREMHFTFPNGLVGSFATTMTIRFQAAPAATNFNSVAGSGYIAG
jgi:hypothetical protein